MLDIVFSSAKWIADTLIQRRSENKDIKREKWIQVADYLDNMAKLIDESVTYLKNDEIPYGNYSHLVEMWRSFDKVLGQVYDEKKDADIIQEYQYNLKRALDLLELIDIVTARLSKLRKNIDDNSDTVISLETYGQKMYPKLQITAGHFHGAAATLRALA